MSGPSKRVARSIAGVLVPTLLLLAGYAIVAGVDAADSGVLGLIDALPPAYFAITGLLALSFVLHVRSDRTAWPVLVAHVIALVFLLHGVVSFIEQNPRFPTAYTHLGLIEYIQRTDSTLTSLDARMSWPGFFATSALLNEIAGVDSSFPFLLWASMVMNLAFAPLLWSIARSATDDRRVPWIATWLFFTVSWVGQDYFAPQAVNFLLFLAFVAVLLRAFRSDNKPLPSVMRRPGNLIERVILRVLRSPKLRPGGSSLLVTGTTQRALLVGTLLVIYAASVVSHQLTPFFLLLVCTALAVLRRTQLRGLPLLLTAGVFTWISYGAVDFWSGHLDEIFGGFGQVSGTVEQNVSSRVARVESDHVWVIYIRLALSLLVWVLAGLGILRRLRTGRTDISLLVCFVAPFLVLAGQSYGGEALLRVFLFCLPFAATFAALALLPDHQRMGALRTGLAVVVLAGLVPAFFVARFGNEQFEYIADNEVAAVDQLFDVAPPGSSLLVVDAAAPWLVQGRDQYDFVRSLKDGNRTNPAAVVDALARRPGDGERFALFTRAQEQAMSQRLGLPRNWGDAFTGQLLQTGRFDLIYENPDARIFKLVEANR